VSDPRVDDLIAKAAIRDVLSRYCRGLDRMDREMAYSVWHEGGTAHYIDSYDGSGRGFIDWVWQAHSAMQRHSHQITNVLIEVAGQAASSEAYVTAGLWTQPDADGAQSEILVRARYLDRWSQRDGRWAIDQRLCVTDTTSVSALAAGNVSAESARDETDPSFAYIPRA
jgi:hypothetical protein